MAFSPKRYAREWALFSEAFENAPKASHMDLGMKRFVFACTASPYIGGHFLFLGIVLTALIAASAFWLGAHGW